MCFGTLTNTPRELLVLVHEIGDGLKFGIELVTLLLEFQVGKTELGLIVTSHA